MSRFPPLDPASMSPAQRSVAEEISSGPRGGVRGPFIALLHHPELARRVQALGEHLRFGTQFDDVLTEIAVLTTARRWNSQYEWVAHEKLARRAGVADATIRAIAEGRTPPGMTADQTIVHTFCVEANRDGAPSETSYEAARERFGAQGVLDLLALCGYYTMLAMVLNTAQLPLPDGVPPPLQPLPRSA